MTTTLLNAIPTTLWDLGAFKTNAKPTPLILVADVTNGAGESRYSALRIPGAAAGYQVPAGKTLYITKLTRYPPLAIWLLLSGTADAGQNQAAAPAGATSLTSRADGIGSAFQKNFLAGETNEERETIISVTETLYPCIRSMQVSATLTILFLAHTE